VIDLTKYIGKRCVIQLCAPDSWLVVHQENGRAELMAVKTPEGPRMVPVPMLIGLILEGNRIEFLDENKMKLEVELNPERILSVAVAVEASRIKIIGE
jgi:hypothetical protein